MRVIMQGSCSALGTAFASVCRPVPPWIECSERTRAADAATRAWRDDRSVLAQTVKKSVAVEDIFRLMSDIGRGATVDVRRALAEREAEMIEGSERSPRRKEAAVGEAEASREEEEEVVAGRVEVVSVVSVESLESSRGPSCRFGSALSRDFLTRYTPSGNWSRELISLVLASLDCTESGMGG